ncbi:phosphoribosylformylglycinamidine cyclo-ligase [Clostridium sp. D2Q-11]|uniref:Phosphoribosylformylglycinamidine cyclo-ligase n=1 Tax=Anaeromonas frigoriresistens TaxID=2683708 RepID=A0A942UWM3_9FIRM|nr:phosphoribosylformylglycinamidine cyclo-ligase [Anaeromonas frigoriresistens]MBS4538900.1 phosphoribosylformylglycinamidine cyclo-ligase [Anaeromonas frigoriresistens]
MTDRLTYSDSGVNIDEGNKAINLMKSHITETFSKDVISTIGGFGGLFNLDLTGINNPVLVSGTDGVGTKLLLALMMDKHDTIGEDLVAMCVNDILCHGAKPLFFLDYFATGNLEGEKVAEVVKGIANGCKLASCSLIGGETAEMPGLYKGKEYDLSGFAVGVVDREKLIDGRNIKTGDIIIGLPSSGIHSNGYSLVRKLFFEKLMWTHDTFIQELGSTLGEVLLTPTKIYWDIVSRLSEKFDIKGMAHITGGGFYENIPRIIPKGLGVDIDLSSWDRPEIFKLIQKLGNIHRDEMFRTFNMGIGYIIVVSKDESDIVLDEMKAIDEKAYIIGEVVDTHSGVKLWQE